MNENVRKKEIEKSRVEILPESKEKGRKKHCIIDKSPELPHQCIYKINIIEI
jgi:hypothetical protein